MPELPEVETIKIDLNKRILGKVIKGIEVNVAKIIKQPSLKEFISKIKGTVFKKIARRGKYLIFELSSGEYLVIHLKVTGQLIYGNKEKQNRVSFLLNDGKYLNFCDLRLFGSIYLVSDLKELKEFIKLGLEPLEKNFTLESFCKMIKGKKTKIKPLLMDQTLIAGIGNIYAQEALFKAKIHPTRTAESLKGREIKELFFSIKEVLKEAIKYRGSSVDAYVDLEGSKGEMGERLQIYGREGEACIRCKTAIRKIKINGRGTSFCPNCQK